MMSKAPVPVVSREMKLPVWMALFSRTSSSWLTGGVVSVAMSGLLRGESGRRGTLPGPGGGDRAEPGEARRVEQLGAGGQGDQWVGHHENDDQVEHGRQTEGEREALHVTDGHQV